MPSRELCPFHPDDDLPGTFVSDETGWTFTCARPGHPQASPYTWLRPPAPPNHTEMTGIAAELALEVNLPAALDGHRGFWVEYGVLERAYALAHPDDWQHLIDLYGHKAIAPKQYTVSAFLGGVLGRLWKNQVLPGFTGPATGRWSYNGVTGWWSQFPEPPRDQLLSWADSGYTVDYVPGSTEAPSA